MSAPITKDAPVRVTGGLLAGLRGVVVGEWPSPWPAPSMWIVRSEAVLHDRIMRADHLVRDDAKGGA